MARNNALLLAVVVITMGLVSAQMLVTNIDPEDRRLRGGDDRRIDRDRGRGAYREDDYDDDRRSPSSSSRRGGGSGYVDTDRSYEQRQRGRDDQYGRRVGEGAASRDRYGQRVHDDDFNRREYRDRRLDADRAPRYGSERRSGYRRLARRELDDAQDDDKHNTYFEEYTEPLKQLGYEPRHRRGVGQAVSVVPANGGGIGQGVRNDGIGQGIGQRVRNDGIGQGIRNDGIGQAIGQGVRNSGIGQGIGQGVNNDDNGDARGLRRRRHHHDHGNGHHRAHDHGQSLEWSHKSRRSVVFGGRPTYRLQHRTYDN